jgi:hypothetical protein
MGERKNLYKLEYIIQGMSLSEIEQKRGVLMFFTILSMKNGRIICRFPLTKRKCKFGSKNCAKFKKKWIFLDTKKFEKFLLQNFKGFDAIVFYGKFLWKKCLN